MEASSEEGGCCESYVLVGEEEETRADPQPMGKITHRAQIIT